jgi:hypothetical protein
MMSRTARTRSRFVGPLSHRPRSCDKSNEDKWVSAAIGCRRFAAAHLAHAVVNVSLASGILVAACGGEDNTDLYSGSGGTAARDAATGGKGAAAKSGSGGTSAGGTSGSGGSATVGSGGSAGKGNAGSAGKGGTGQLGSGGVIDASAGKSGAGGALGADASTPDAPTGGAAGARGLGGSAGALGSNGNAGAAGTLGGAGADGGPTGSTPGDVACGNEVCDLPGQVCCFGGLTGPASCFPILTGCVTFGVPIRCDERADCQGGQRCCGDKAVVGDGYTTACHNNGCADPSLTFCRTQSECSGGTTCKPISGFEAFSACQM